MGGLVSTHTHTHKVEGLPWHLWLKLASLTKIAMTVTPVVPFCAHAHFLLGLFLSLHLRGEWLFCFLMASSFIKSSFLSTLILLIDWQQHLQKTSHSFQLRKTNSNLAFFKLSAPKELLSTFWKFLWLYQFEENLMLTRCFFKPAIICLHQNCRWNNTHLYWTQHYSKITCAIALFHGGNDSANSTATTHSSRN